VIKNVFQRSNKNLKVTITNNYKLLLKPVLWKPYFSLFVFFGVSKG
jgi:hypothetical protein